MTAAILWCILQSAAFTHSDLADCRADFMWDRAWCVTDTADTLFSCDEWESTACQANATAEEEEECTNEARASYHQCKAKARQEGDARTIEWCGTTEGLP